MYMYIYIIFLIKKLLLDVAKQGSGCLGNDSLSSGLCACKVHGKDGIDSSKDIGLPPAHLIINEAIAL